MKTTALLRDAYDELIGGPCGLPTTEVVNWLDRYVRPAFVTQLGRRNRCAAEVDIYEAWSTVLLRAYTDSITGRHWNDLAHVVRWCFAIGHSSLGYAIRYHRQASFQSSGQRHSVKCISQLASEQMDEVAEAAAQEKVPHQTGLGSSRDWLAKGIASLTPKQREAVDLVITMEASAPRSVEYTKGRSVGSINNSKISALYRVAIASPDMDLSDLSRMDPWVRTAREQMTPLQWNVFDLVVLGRHSEREAARLLGIAQPAVTMNKQRAVLKLASCLHVRKRAA